MYEGEGYENFGIVGWSVHTSFLKLVFCSWCNGGGTSDNRGAIGVLCLLLLFKVYIFSIV